MLFYPYQMLRGCVAVSDIAEFVQLFDVFFVADCSELKNPENQGVTLMALKYLLATPTHCLPSKFSLRRDFFFLVLQVPQINPMLYLSDFSIFSHFIGYTIYID